MGLSELQSLPVKGNWARQLLPPKSVVGEERKTCRGTAEDGFEQLSATSVLGIHRSKSTEMQRLKMLAEKVIKVSERSDFPSIEGLKPSFETSLEFDVIFQTRDQ